MVRTTLILAFIAISGSRPAACLNAPFYDPNTWLNRSGIVHLFEWKWLDIAKECEDFLAPKGYAAVQISPPTENLIVKLDNGHRPWYERYQPLSYRLVTRSGNEREFAEMTRRCNQVGVRIYADVVINHMTGDLDNAVGTGGSTGSLKDMSYPAVPYNITHFHTPKCSINNYNDANNVRNCELVGLHDLNHSHAYVRDKIIGMMDHLIELGVAGFRVDAVKHMWPQDVLAMMEGLKPLSTSFGFPPNSKAFVYQEVIDMGGEAISYKEYSHIGRLLDFQHSSKISRVFRGDDQLRWLRNWGQEWNLIFGPISVVFVDNHDNQRENDGKGPILNYKRPKQYKMAVAFMLAHPHAVPRVMSSFHFEKANQGPPMSPDGNIISPIIDRNECVNGWVCEHRWRQISNMIGFRNAAGSEPVNYWWDNGSNQIAFGRGRKAFIAFNNENQTMEMSLSTGLPPGTYCDIISGELTPSRRGCSGKTIVVAPNGIARFEINPYEHDGVLAIHVDAKIQR